MNVHLTFDIEVWCDGWDALDQTFPRNFERYVYGRSRHGDYALPKTLEILNRNGLKGIFFVEPLFSARFGAEHLATIVGLIRDAGQEVQLHLHPEWTDEIDPPLIPNSSVKRQHLSYYTEEEQAALIAFGKRRLQECGSGPVSVFRAGSFAANRDTYAALRANGIALDSSLNRCYDVSGADLRGEHGLVDPARIAGVLSYPVTVFTDGLGRQRPAHVNACAFPEMRQALLSAQAAGVSNFVIVSHNFEMLKPGQSEPSWLVVRRFEQLCAFLGQQRDTLPVGSFPATAPAGGNGAAPSTGLAATLQRLSEQALSRVL